MEDKIKLMGYELKQIHNRLHKVFYDSIFTLHKYIKSNVQITLIYLIKYDIPDINDVRDIIINILQHKIYHDEYYFIVNVFIYNNQLLVTIYIQQIDYYDYFGTLPTDLLKYIINKLYSSTDVKNILEILNINETNNRLIR